MAKKGKRKAAPGDVATNRQASYRYELLERWECGIVLQGSEVKSLREGGAQLKDAYATLHDGECGCTTCTSRPTGPPRARTTSPSARASCSCTGARSSG